MKHEKINEFNRLDSAIIQLQNFKVTSKTYANGDVGIKVGDCALSTKLTKEEVDVIIADVEMMRRNWIKILISKAECTVQSIKISDIEDFDNETRKIQTVNEEEVKS